jgi:hypothetical protein
MLIAGIVLAAALSACASQDETGKQPTRANEPQLRGLHSSKPRRLYSSNSSTIGSMSAPAPSVSLSVSPRPRTTGITRSISHARSTPSTPSNARRRSGAAKSRANGFAYPLGHGLPAVATGTWP